MNKNFLEYQKKWHEKNVEVNRFYWQTKNLIIMPKEKRLLDYFIKNKDKHILEVGCGEGANSVNINSKKYVGCDYSKSRIKFASNNGIGCFIVSDGTNLSFKDNSFDIVFCRDVIHHVMQREKLISEIYRVCKINGRIIILEPNGINPVNYLFSIVSKKCNDIKYMTPRYISKLLTKYDYQMSFSEPYNLDRFIFHYAWGIPKLAHFNFIRNINGFVIKLCEKFIKPKYWGHIYISINKLDKV